MNYKEEFKKGALPDGGEFDNVHADIKICLPLVSSMQLCKHQKFFNKVPNIKDSKEIRGNNLFFKKINWGYFKFEEQTTENRKKLIFNYNNKRNPFFIRPLKGELRKTGEDRYLGLAQYMGIKLYFYLIFTFEKQK